MLTDSILTQGSLSTGPLLGWQPGLQEQVVLEALPLFGALGGVKKANPELELFPPSNGLEATSSASLDSVWGY